jgi:hypothetical protein
MAGIVYIGAPTPAGALLGAVSQSTGSILLDAALGAGLGYVIAPDEEERVSYTAWGAAASGLGGLLGVAVLLGYRYVVIARASSRRSSTKA